MSFFDRYLDLCNRRGLQPMSQKAADQFGVTRATITAWSKNKTVPKGDTVALIASALNVSTDYLLGRTDDPTDYSTQGAPDGAAGQTPDATSQVGAASGSGATQPRILGLYEQLDPIDQVRVEAYVEGILSTDKYRVPRLSQKIG